MEQVLLGGRLDLLSVGSTHHYGLKVEFQLELNAGLGFVLDHVVRRRSEQGGEKSQPVFSFQE